MKKIESYITPILIFLVSFLLRLSLISKGPYHIDCLNLAIKAKQTLDTGTLQNLFGSGYPLTVILGAFFVFLGRLFSIPDPIIMVNFMSIVFSSLAVLILYFLCRNEFDENTGIFASLFFSVTPIYLGISVYGKSHAPSIFFLLASIYYLLQYHRGLNKKNLLIASILMGFMGASRLQDMILVAPAIAYLHLSQNVSLKEKRRELFFFFIIAGLIITTCHLPYFISSQSASFKSQFSSFWGQGVTHGFRGLLSPALLFAFDYFLTTLTVLGLIMAAIGLFFIARKEFRLFIFFSLWFIIPLLFYGNLWTITPRFFAFSIIPLFIGQGYLLSKFFTYKKFFKLWALFFSFLLTYLSLTLIYPTLLFRHKNDLLPQYAHWLQKITEKDATIIVGGDHGRFFTYYANLNIMGKPNGRFRLKEKILWEYKQRIDSLLERNKPLYISENDLHVYDFHNQVSAFLMQNYSLEPVGAHYTEFWHKGSYRQLIFYDTLFRVKQKKR